MHNPFSFKGRIGRIRFWLTMLLLSVAWLIDVGPVKEHVLVLTNFGGDGEWTVAYVTPVEPITATSWFFWCFNVAWALVMVWAFASAIVQRLNDLGQSWKWAAAILGVFLAVTAIEVCFGHPGAPLSLADVLSLILLAPACVIGAFGTLMLEFAPGYISRHDRMLDGDLRKAAS